MMSRRSKTVIPMIKVPVLTRLCLAMCLALLANVLRANLASDLNVSAMNSLVSTEVEDELVAKYVNDFLKHPVGTEELLGRGQIYFPVIERELRVLGLPDDLKVLPLIESRFDPMAVSSVGAAGLWQFMIPTARELGLTISKYLDERRDPVKATKAALTYLASLFDKYNDWALAFAAYNAGPGTVNRAIKQAGGHSSFEAIKAFLPSETQNYIPKYIAAQYIIEYHKDLGLHPSAPSLDLQWTTTVQVHEGMTLQEVADVVDLPLEIVQLLNPSLRKQYVPKLKCGYELILPKRVAGTFRNFISTASMVKTNFAYRTIEMMVERTQSLYELAMSLKVDPYLFKSWNQIKADVVEAGHRIVIHELYDPSQVMIQRIDPEPFVKYREALERLSPTMSYQDKIARLVSEQRKRMQEENAWQMHQQ